jgi:hypothetical protein
VHVVASACDAFPSALHFQIPPSPCFYSVILSLTPSTHSAISPTSRSSLSAVATCRALL